VGQRPRRSQAPWRMLCGEGFREVDGARDSRRFMVPLRAAANGSRNNKRLIVWHGSIKDPDGTGRYTLKRYESQKVVKPDDPEPGQHITITLHPKNKDYAPINLGADESGSLRVVAELLKVLQQSKQYHADRHLSLRGHRTLPGKGHAASLCTVAVPNAWSSPSTISLTSPGSEAWWTCDCRVGASRWRADCAQDGPAAGRTRQAGRDARRRG
jgi:hypothetical protein